MTRRAPDYIERLRAERAAKNYRSLPWVRFFAHRAYRFHGYEIGAVFFPVTHWKDGELAYMGRLCVELDTWALRCMWRSFRAIVRVRA